jgi:hypothetical protein
MLVLGMAFVTGQPLPCQSQADQVEVLGPSCSFKSSSDFKIIYDRCDSNSINGNFTLLP